MDELMPKADLGFLASDLSLGAQPLSAGRASSPAAVSATDQKKQQVAKDFESILLTRLFAQVQQTMASLNPEEEDGTGKQVQGLFWMYLAQDVADKGGLGLWKDIYQQMRQRDATPNQTAALNEEL